MSFIADKQTLDDLNLLGKYRPDSIFSLFNKLHTTGGERKLQEMFQHPMVDVEAINTRSNMFRYFQNKQLKFPVDGLTFQKAETYLNTGTSANFLLATTGLLHKKALAVFLHDEQFGQLLAGLNATVEVLRQLQRLMLEMGRDAGSPFEQSRKQISAILDEQGIRDLLSEVFPLPLMKIAWYDHLLKHTLQLQMGALLNGICLLDVYIGVSLVARERGFSYALALPKEANCMRSAGLWHPGLMKGVANPLSLGREQNMIFLTGANMAGKSTFMKSFGIAVYLSHMGFPVAARQMEFSVCDGLYSSINVPDDLNLGYSHFYAEVLRVKNAAESVGTGQHLVVLFDELFKGTNVKDAYDATLAVTEAFSKYRNCFFIISTHIIEVGTALQERCRNVGFSYLPTVMDGHVPRYTYQLQEGITTDRQGMLIIENEGILEMLKT
ncbi:putative mismatch repair-like protein [Pedobacter sp. BAL39]|uniref:MutS-related protein n=1 Tax=Pedobacter sp. BAL39 TaxID=391596 RepID=UPI0001559E5C|nr:DNA mismatch repair protein [Pedobacter sp. BAL39]EDM35529.1 putative mismatch repair-like protein [Pedobacter sp. BAL39]